MSATEADLLIVGAGVAGLSCASRLHHAGRRVVVLEKSRGVGGRCATRRVEGQPVDHGPGFLHGADPGFLDAVDGLPSAERIDGWPSRTRGEGRPCLPRAFGRGERCIALRSGVTGFPKSMAPGLDIRLDSELRSIDATGDSIHAIDDKGRDYRARTLVLTPPVPQTLQVIDSLPDRSREIEAIRSLLRMMTSLPCLVVLAGYPTDVPAQDWQVRYPEESKVLQVISLDSDKRTRPSFTVLVLQCLPNWSRKHLEADPDSWSSRVLDEARDRLGPWAGAPVWTQAHRWRHARAGTGNELTRPLLLTLAGGARIAVAGEVFSPGGGVQGAWLSGRSMAGRLLREEEP